MTTIPSLIAELVKALRPFAGLCPIDAGDTELPNDRMFHVARAAQIYGAISLGEIRRASEAISHANAVQSKVCPACGYPIHGSICLKSAGLTGCILEEEREQEGEQK